MALVECSLETATRDGDGRSTLLNGQRASVTPSGKVVHRLLGGLHLQLLFCHDITRISPRLVFPLSCHEMNERLLVCGECVHGRYVDGHSHAIAGSHITVDGAISQCVAFFVFYGVLDVVCRTAEECHLVLNAEL